MVRSRSAAGARAAGRRGCVGHAERASGGAGDVCRTVLGQSIIQYDTVLPGGVWCA